MPAAATTVTAQWANATQASYQVVYWGENLTGGYDYLYADKATGAVGGNIPYSTSLTGSRMPQGLEAAGFELDSAKSAGNVEITADGSAVKNVYFSRRTFTICLLYTSAFRRGRRLPVHTGQRAGNAAANQYAQPHFTGGPGAGFRG